MIAPAYIICVVNRAQEVIYTWRSCRQRKTGYEPSGDRANSETEAVSEGESDTLFPETEGLLEEVPDPMMEDDTRRGRNAEGPSGNYRVLHPKERRYRKIRSRSRPKGRRSVMTRTARCEDQTTSEIDSGDDTARGSNQIEDDCASIITRPCHPADDRAFRMMRHAWKLGDPYYLQHRPVDIKVE